MSDQNKAPEFLGRHFLAEYYECDREKIKDVRFIEDIMVGAAEKIGATIVDRVFHQFNPHGVSGIVVIAESHISVHTWPEFDYAAVDIFSCSDSINPEEACTILKHRLCSRRVEVREIKRGKVRRMVPSSCEGD